MEFCGIEVKGIKVMRVDKLKERVMKGKMFWEILRDGDYKLFSYFVIISKICRKICILCIIFEIF